MNIPEIRVTYLALATLLSAASCTKEAAEPEVYDWANSDIYFRTSLEDVAPTRATDMTLDQLESFQVTCFNTGDIQKDASGYIRPYFGNATFIRQTNAAGITYVSSPAEGPREWPAAGGVLKFFAFTPSLNAMVANNDAIKESNKNRYFNLINTSTEVNSVVNIDYRLDGVRVNRDISRQFDFITAEATGERWKDFTNGVELAFHHQMSRVELRAWGNNPAYNFEIAGVRLGNPVIEGSFIFPDASWRPTAKDKVEYIFQAADDTHIADQIYTIDTENHATAESAESIMGAGGGPAMVIPTVNAKWEGLDDPAIATVPYTTDKMYFSVLLRVKSNQNGNTLYPYPNTPANMTVVYFAVDATGKILSRLYPGTAEGAFYKDEARQEPYIPVEGEEIKDFSWAAIPVDADWAAGKSYVYTLNYSEGVGWHDPEDPEPGKPIFESGNIPFDVKIDTWKQASKDNDPNFNPDLNVPKR